MHVGVLRDSARPAGQQAGITTPVLETTGIGRLFRDQEKRSPPA